MTDDNGDRLTLIDYPSPFPIKVMGPNVPEFKPAIIALARRFDPTFDASAVHVRPSSAGNYLGLTITVMATSREQLDDIYRALSSHPMVRYTL
jgi:putative lipoic acid-binding regulatory protein